MGPPAFHPSATPARYPPFRDVRTATRTATQEASMTPQERQLAAGLFDRLASLEDMPRNRDADRTIEEGFSRPPTAPYPLLQPHPAHPAPLNRPHAPIQRPHPP